MTNSEHIIFEQVSNRSEACATAMEKKERHNCPNSDDEESYKPFAHLPDPAFGAELVWWKMLSPIEQSEISKQEVDLAEIHFQLQSALDV